MRPAAYHSQSMCVPLCWGRRRGSGRERDAMLPRTPHAIPGRVIAAAAALVTVGLCLTPGPAAASASTVTGHLLFSSSGANGGLLTDGAAVAAPRAASPSYTVFAGMDLPNEITRGPDGAWWFTNVGSNSIGRLSAGGTLSDFTAAGINSPGGITAGPDGALWFTNEGTFNGSAWAGSSIGRIAVNGSARMFHAPSIVDPSSITVASDGALWFTNAAVNIPGQAGSIGRISVSGTIRTFTGAAIHHPAGITAGPDGALWFTNSNNTIGRITTKGVTSSFASPAVK